MADNSEDQGKSGGKKIGIKFLLSNSLAGSLIGTGGKSIKELIAITEARVIVSGSSDTYPGTTDRVILVQGSKDAVSLAQTLIWEMIGLMTKARENREEGEDKSKVTEWNPRTAYEALGSDQSNDDVEVSAKFTIPAAAGGAVLGRGGESIRSMGESSGANIAMSGKDEALFTQERVVSISGTVSQCIQCTDLVLQKLWDQSEAMVFANRGTTYASPLTTTLGMLGLETRGPRGGRGGRGGRRDGGRPRSSEGGEESAAEKAAKSGAIEQAVGDTTITLSVPDELIGNIFGRNGSTLREIIALSHARVVVSPRGEYVDNTTNRLVTITGSPTAAQTAHLFITQRLHTPSNPPPRNSGRKQSSK